jgi:hypothetical protein
MNIVYSFISAPFSFGSFFGPENETHLFLRNLPTSAEVKKMWIYTSISPYAFVA